MIELEPIIENKLGYPLNVVQQHILRRLQSSERQELVSIPTGRRAGKTSLAVALMQTIRDAIVVLPNIRMADSYHIPTIEPTRDRIFFGAPYLADRRPSLVIFDEIQDILYINHIRQLMPRSRMLHIYTPHNEMNNIPQELHDIHRLSPFSIEGREFDIQSLTDSYKKKNIEWDEDENSM